MSSPFATDGEASAGQANLGRMPRRGDLGDKFAVGAGKIGQGELDMRVYAENYAVAQDTSKMSRLKNSIGGGNILAHKEQEPQH